MREIIFRAAIKQPSGKYYWDYFHLYANDQGAVKVQYFEKQYDTPWMQFTGLKDKNGKEIYEGDIVEMFGIVSRYIVKFGTYKRRPFMNKDYPCENHGFYLDGIPFEDRTGINNNEQKSIIRDNLIVVGNIYENPELLK